LTATSTPTLTSTPLAIVDQSADNQTAIAGNAVAYATVYSPTTSAYTATWQAWMGGGQVPRTISSFSGTLSAGNNNFSGATAIDASFYDYGAGYYNVGGAGYYRFTITVGGVSVSTGFIKINTQGVTQGYQDCGCGCKDAYGNIVGSYEETTQNVCHDNCCCYDCNGDGITACGNPADPDYDDSNPPCQNKCGDGVTDACGESCNDETSYNCTAGTYNCDQCPYDIYGSINYPQY